MERLFQALRVAWSDCNYLPNVVGVGVGYKEKGQERTDNLVVQVFVTTKMPRSELLSAQLVPQRIGDVETDVIEVGEVRLLATARTGRFRPAQPGSSIGHYKVTAGTFGAVVRDIKTGEPLILSNNHVLANSSNGRDGRARIGDPILLPGIHDGGRQEKDVIAHLERFAPVTLESQEANCPISQRVARTQNLFVHLVRPNYDVRFFKRTGWSNTVDCAVAKPVSLDLIRPEILEIGPIRGVAEAKIGEILKKSGRTTGLTHGPVTSIKATLRVDMGSNNYALFSDQIVAQLGSQGGDSGSLVVNSNNEAVGLLFAGSDRITVVNRIQNVLSQLQVSF
ncbi:MAG: hypothetical protein GX062_01915 [Firmicutes bacterium]|nr:hypothetical protein [Bacillota bacterium]